MTTGMLGQVRCAHRWREGPSFPYPRPPTLAREEGDYGGLGDLIIETGVCKRCGCARIRCVNTAREFYFSGWAYADSMVELLLGRELDDGDRRRMLAGLVLN